MHHLARRTSLVGRQPEALRRREVGRGRMGEVGEEEREDEWSNGCRTTDGN